ncbi:type II CAAX prenyl endopeptidase Rce1 family protein [Yersinia sp. 2542 StPb PI]|uniref:CPBP family glutamic-type intramembrane protease n=1 Tax=Yersinia sp. 2542 StPb PI TaxID=3117408 RepID=UPI003B28A739
MIPHLSLWIIISAGVAFYCINAAVEKWVFRGILFKELSSERVSTEWVILLQAISFGCLHWQGIPGGKAGVLRGYPRMDTLGVRWLASSLEVSCCGRSCYFFRWYYIASNLLPLINSQNVS